MLPYGGIVIDKALSDNILSHSRRLKADGTCNTNADYLIEAGETNQMHINGHPNEYKKLYPQCPNHAWIGTYCNEPSKHERANCELVFLPADTDAASIPDYPYIDKQHLIWLHVAFDLDKGEELLVKYGWSEKRYKSMNYTPGYGLYEYKPPVVAPAKPLSSSLHKTMMHQLNATRCNNLKNKTTLQIIGNKKRSRRGFASNGYNETKIKKTNVACC